MNFGAQTMRTQKKRAKQFVEGHDVELWHRDQRIAIFKHETN
jgi:hypothetical protein